MDLSDMPWSDIYNLLRSNGNGLKCLVNGKDGYLIVERSKVRGLETWIFILESEFHNGTVSESDREKIVEVSCDFCQNMKPVTNGVSITKAEVH